MKSHRFQKLDVRPLLRKGIQPLATINSRLDALGPGEGLELTAPFLPAPLIEMLVARGFQHRLERADDGSWSVWFWRDAPPANTLAP